MESQFDRASKVSRTAIQQSDARHRRSLLVLLLVRWSSLLKYAFHSYMSCLPRQQAGKSSRPPAAQMSRPPLNMGPGGSSQPNPTKLTFQGPVSCRTWIYRGRHRSTTETNQLSGEEGIVAWIRSDCDSIIRSSGLVSRVQKCSIWGYWVGERQGASGFYIQDCGADENQSNGNLKACPSNCGRRR